MLSLGQLYTDANANDDDNNNTQQTNHDCIGSLACMPNEPKTLTAKKSTILLWFPQQSEIQDTDTEMESSPCSGTQNIMHMFREKSTRDVYRCPTVQ